MQKYFSFLCALPFLILSLQTVHAQEKITPTDHIEIVGLVENNLDIQIADLEKYNSQTLPDLVITSHKGDYRKELTQLKGILLIDLLKEVVIKADSPKILSEYYLIFEASDGYKVVYSWNELFNSPTGSHVFLITHKSGTGITKMEDRLLVVNTNDIQTGRRHIKSLSKITVKRVD
ncbi:molybdopterin-binding protein [Galbibacter pacificus]|uniref:Molybdopterin-binding protein n=1 Tax=Galbibacter pacificus TaxID=2996052 RepID=A0ABT6FV17_9FLAO|nr:molybdopterin-binding protein [Galbibacter pacificus]MDG3583408.1 molybdopterin-binding protein [Galbibacter pacificus]MDG3587115.1 molybdopterin-binding protein [Galbibacter pacificus]